MEILERFKGRRQVAKLMLGSIMLVRRWIGMMLAKPFRRHGRALLVVNRTFQKLKVGQFVRVTREALDPILIEPCFQQLRAGKARDWIDMIDVKLVAQINEREEQRKQREHAFIAVFHMHHIFDFGRLEGERFTALSHDLTQLGDRERVCPARLNRLA